MNPTTIQKFAPHVYLFPLDMHRPISLDDYYKTVWLFDGDGAIISQNVTAEVLSQNSSPSDSNLYLALPGTDPKDKDENVYPNAKNNFQTGAPLADDGSCLAPMYVNVLDLGDYYNIVYAMFYAFNGFQTWRGESSATIFSTKNKDNFEWSRFARHGGDWEHVTVRVDKNEQLLGVFYGQHGDSQWYTPDELSFTDETHPVVYSAWNSHASYKSS